MGDQAVKRRQRREKVTGLRQLRYALGITIAEFAESVAIPPSTLTKIELGYFQCSVEQAVRIAWIWGCDPCSLRDGGLRDFDGRKYSFSGSACAWEAVTDDFKRSVLTRLIGRRLVVEAELALSKGGAE